VGRPGHVALATQAPLGKQKLRRLRMLRRVARVAGQAQHCSSRVFDGFSRHFRRQNSMNYAE
jgi:hypothetical protein